PDGERGRARTQREQRAKEMCRRCPVIEACRSHALEVGEPYGVWGGLSESERDLLLKGTMGRTRGIRRTA
ncbi:redox-responsive transcriptional regulator WhiB3, partial [Mycobacterium tuberculosis]